MPIDLFPNSPHSGSILALDRGSVSCSSFFPRFYFRWLGLVGKLAWLLAKTIGGLLVLRSLNMSLNGDSAVTLSWSDFQGTVPANSTRKALTSTTFDIQTPFAFRIDGKTKRQTDFRMTSVAVSLTLERKSMWSQTSARTRPPRT